jgi:hypothetical protein
MPSSDSLLGKISAGPPFPIPACGSGLSLHPSCTVKRRCHTTLHSCAPNPHSSTTPGMLHLPWSLSHFHFNTGCPIKHGPRSLLSFVAPRISIYTHARTHRSDPAPTTAHLAEPAQLYFKSTSSLLQQHYLSHQHDNCSSIPIHALISLDSKPRVNVGTGWERRTRWSLSRGGRWTRSRRLSRKLPRQQRRWPRSWWQGRIQRRPWRSIVK